MSPVMFISYSRLNAKDPDDKGCLKKLKRDLESNVEQKLGTAVAELSFLDTTDIETGDEWPEELSESVATSAVAVCLYSPSYFNSAWCSREFRAFLDRRDAARLPGRTTSRPKAIVPVQWMKAPLPKEAEAFQAYDDEFPPEYVQMGLRRIMRLGRSVQDIYEAVVEVIGDRVVGAVRGIPLPELANFDLRQAPFAWPVASPSRPGSQTSGAVTKACFVYLAREGWHWRPYDDPPQKIGVFAQQLSADLSLQYAELACTPQLPNQLKQANTDAVPTLIISDPSSVDDPVINGVMRAYDSLYLLNCGVVVPWEKEAPPADRRWEQLTREVCPQKTLSPPPDHEWRTIFSFADLRQRALTAVENIRLRLLQRMLAAGVPSAARVENVRLEHLAAARGVSVRTTPVVSNVAG